MPSSVIERITYNEAKSTLQVVFVSGAVYEYKKVPLRVYEAMKNAVSKGSFLNYKIKGNYKFDKIQ